MQIRLATERDIPAISALLKQVAAVHSDLRPDLFRQQVSKHEPEALVPMLHDAENPIFVAELDGEVVGSMFCMLRRYGAEGLFLPYLSLYIDDFCVNEAHRGKGVGKQMYQFAREFAAQNGCHNVTLSVWTANESALRFYEACGLQPQRMVMEARIAENTAAAIPEKTKKD